MAILPFPDRICYPQGMKVLKLCINSRIKDVKIKSLIRIGIQLLLSGLIFYGLVGSTPELKLLFVVLIFVNIAAVFLSTFTSLTIGKAQIKYSIILNLVISFCFFLLGFYLRDLLTYEVIEEMSVDKNDPRATVIKARLVSYGGIEFFLIFIIHSLLSYVDFLVIRLTKEEPESAKFSGSLFSVKIGKKLHLIPFSEIDFIEASGNYVHIYQGDKQYPARLTLQEFHEKAQSDILIRVHRSFVINMSQIREFEGSGDGYSAVLRNGRKIKIGKQYKKSVFQRLGIED